MPTNAAQVEEIQAGILLILLVRLIEEISRILIQVQADLQVDLRADPRVDPLAEMVDIHVTHDIITITERETTRPTRRLPMSRLLKVITKMTKRMNAIEIAFNSFRMASNRTLFRWLLEFLLKFPLLSEVATSSLKPGSIMSSLTFN